MHKLETECEMPTEDATFAAAVYTPGHGDDVVRFMERRSLQTHGAFFEPHLVDARRVLDVGCGPGTITMGIARQLADARVIGVDVAPSQVERAREAAALARVPNVEFLAASGYDLPFPDCGFDRIFSHALMEHLAEPARAIAEMRRVLAPGGVVGVCSPDWGGFVVAPSSAELDAAIGAYTSMQTRNGGDVNAGRRLGGYLLEGGFMDVSVSARYECYEAPGRIAEYLGLQLAAAGMAGHAQALRKWSLSPVALFAQCWICSVGVK
jgi:SAM-dependent methyltransferase